jgi:hypoxanthine-guanine phosphoribosyltransferase
MSGLRVLFSAAEIAVRVDALAVRIARTVPADFVMVGLLKSAAVFVADLARALVKRNRCRKTFGCHDKAASRRREIRSYCV